MSKLLKISVLLLMIPVVLCGCTVGETDTDTTRQTVTSPYISDVIDTLPPTEQTTETNAPSDITSGTESGQAVEPPQSDSKKISFMFCGDNLAHQAVINNAKAYAKGTGREYNFLPIYDSVADIIKNADIAVINQESQIAGSVTKIAGYPRFNTPEQMGEDLITLGFDVVTLANNHMLDNGTDGLLYTVSYWRSKPVLSVGAYTDADDYEQIRTFTKNGVTVAFLAYTEMTNSNRRAEGDVITPLLDENVVRRQIAAAKNVADIVIVLPHWGREDSFDVTATQAKFAKIFAECNVDAVIGMHSHVTGKIEYITRADGGQMLCAYSLGNFVSTMEKARSLVGLMLGFDAEFENGAYTVKNAHVIPTVTYFTYTESKKQEDRDNLRLYLLSDFTEELASKHAYNEHESTKIGLYDLKKYVTGVVDKEFLPDYLK